MSKSKMSASMVALALVCAQATPIAAATGWQQENGTWTYTNTNGRAAKGWQEIGDCWYVFDTNGLMKTGWVASDEFWYFLGGSGVMQNSTWIEDGGYRYYLKPTGVMATDYVKDGYELQSDGKAVLLSETKSVVVTADNVESLAGQTIEGNLYVDADTYHDLTIADVTVKGKLVVMGTRAASSTITVKNATINELSSQARGAEIVLSGDTEVKKVVVQENSEIVKGSGYNGTIDTYEIQATAKGDVEVNVKADNVSTTTFSPVVINAEVDELTVKKNTTVTVNEDVKNVTVGENAADTTLDIKDDVVVGTVIADALVEIEGAGTVNKLEANVDGVTADEDTIIKDVEKGSGVTEAPEVNKPSSGGSSSGGGSYVPPVVDKTVAKVSNADELKAALADQTKTTIQLTADITVTYNSDLSKNGMVIVSNLTRNIKIDGQNHKITITGGQENHWDGSNYAVQVYNNGDKTVTFENIYLTGGDAGLLVNGSTVVIGNNVDVSGNEFGGIELSSGTGVTNQSVLKVTGTIINSNETATRPTVWTDGTNVNVDATGKLTSKAMEDDKVYYYLNNQLETVKVVSDVNELKAALSDVEISEIALDKNFKLNNQNLQLTAINHDVIIDGNGVVLRVNDTENWSGNYVVQIYNSTGKVTLKNMKLTGGDAGLLVNASTVEIGEGVDVSGNEFGGIEVSVGNGLGTNVTSTLTVTSEITNDTEAANNPTVWTDKSNEGKPVVNAESYLHTKQHNNTQDYYFINEELVNTEIVSSVDDLNAALNDSSITEITLADNFDTNNQKLQLVNIDHDVVIDGNGAELSLSPAEGWNGDYVVQIYRSTGTVTLKNMKLTGGDAALLVNGSQVELDNVDVSGNEFGGVEVSKGTGVTETPTLTATNLTNTSEAYKKPTVWIDGEGVTSSNVKLEDAIKLTVTKDDGKTQQQFYINKPTISSTMPETVSVNTETEFAISTEANGLTNTTVKIGGINNYTDKMTLWYKSGADYVEMNGEFSPDGGFPLTTTSSEFKVKFTEAGEYSFTINVTMADDPNTVLCDTTINVSVTAENIVVE